MHMNKILWLAFVLLGGTYVAGPLIDPDLWWHIVIGKWILAHGEIPTVDHWTMFGRGEPWRAYSWAPEALFAFIESHWSLTGLVVAKLFLAFALVFSLAYIVVRISGNWFSGTAIALLIMLSTTFHFTLRPQTFVWGYLAWVIYFAEGIRQDKKASLKALFSIFTVMVLWANTHLSTVLGLGAIGLWLFDPKQSKLLVSALAAGFLGTLVTPYLGAEWLTFFGKANHALHYTWIAEFKPAHLLEYPTAFLILTSALFIALFWNAPRALAPSQVALFFVFLFGALAVKKFIPFSMIVTSLLIARLIKESGKQNNLLEGLRRLEVFFHSIPKEGLTFVILVFVFLNARFTVRKEFVTEAFPVKAIDFVQEQSLDFPILNDFGDGGYLMYRLSDERGELAHPVAIDGRTNVTPPDKIQRFVNAFFGKPKWYEFVTDVDPETVIWSMDSPLVSILLATGEWCAAFLNPDKQSGAIVLIKSHKYQILKEDMELPRCNPFFQIVKEDNGVL